MQHLAVTGDDREQIVEVVRNPARQATHSFHLLGVAKLLFEALTLSDVDHGRHGSQLIAFRIENRPAARQYSARFALFGNDHHLHVADPFALEGTKERNFLLL